MGMIKCPECGKKISDSSTSFCTQCGKKVPGPSPFCPQCEEKLSARSSLFGDSSERTFRVLHLFASHADTGYWVSRHDQKRFWKLFGAIMSIGICVIILLLTCVIGIISAVF